MTTAQELEALQTEQPFRLFEVCLTDGRMIELVELRKFLLTGGSVHAGVPAKAEIPDRTERVALAHIASTGSRTQ